MRAQSMKSLDTIAVHGRDLEAKDMEIGIRLKTTMTENGL